MSVLTFAAASAWAQGRAADEEELMRRANSGDADAQFEAGVRQVTGEGLRKDAKEGAKWIEKAAKQKHRQAMHVMGTLFEDGVGVPKDIARAHEWYEKGAASGFPASQHQLGILYEDGIGVSKDPVKAASWFKKAAEQGLAQAQTAYAAKLESGVGVAKSAAKAALWYLRSAQQNFVPAMTRLANLYYTGEGVPVDYRRARAWYQVAATSEDPWSANNLAWFYATCPDDDMHNGEKAVEQAKRALKLVVEVEQREEHPYEMVDTMAAALARNGEYKEAELWQKRTLTLLAEDKKISKEDRSKLESEFQGRLQLYQKHTPYHDPESKGQEGAEPLPEDTILQDLGEPERQQPKKQPRKNSRGTVV
ncbi:MAG: sel1 repeat family protein [Verrucomicrobiaceae bacterium]|nr:sel1 repeat family protein [Verrucomicrobiaceae bacterium]